MAKVFETTINSSSGSIYNITIVKGESITINSIRSGRYDTAIQDYRTVTNSITFKIGDTCEEDSFNLSYLGTITGITEKSVIIDTDMGSSKRRMKLAEFATRNHSFDIIEIKDKNAETMMYI